MSAFPHVRFLTSSHQARQFPPDVGAEVAVAGRSNAGKSSAINALCGQKGLARTSKTPGRTQLLNFFALDDDRRLVDLPGYGYAAVAASIRAEWQGAVAPYIERRRSLQGVVVLTDIRHPLRDLDLQLVDWAWHLGRPVHVLLTKADKLGRGKATATLLAARKVLADYPHAATTQLFSAVAGQGLEVLAGVLDGWLRREGPAPASG